MAWNGSKNGGASSAPEKPMPKAPARFRVLFALVAMAVLGVALFLFFMRGGDEPTVVKKKVRESVVPIAEVKPARAPSPVQVEEVKERTTSEIRHWPREKTNELTQAEYDYWKLFNATIPPDKDQPKPNLGRYHIFKERANNEIAFILDTEPGTAVFGSGAILKGFEKRFLKSLNTPIEVKDDDDEYTKTLKKAVLQAKIELKCLYDAGQDIEKVMVEARENIQNLGRYKAQLEEDALKMIKRDSTDQEVQDTLEAVNAMLDRKGIAPLELNSMSRLAMRMQSALKRNERIRQNEQNEQ